MTKYCLVSNGGKVGVYPRRWFDDLADAVEHGENIIKESFRAGACKPQTIYVVEMVRVVEIGIPAVCVRGPNDADGTSTDADELEEEPPMAPKRGKYGR